MFVRVQVAALTVLALAARLARRGCWDAGNALSRLTLWAFTVRCEVQLRALARRRFKVVPSA